MRRLLVVPAFAVLPVLLAAQTPEQLSAAAGTISSETFASHVRVIAHDSMRGRDTPSAGLEATARYLADQFKALGLKPAGDNGSWFQRYPIPAQLDFTKSQVVFTSGDKKAVASFMTAARLADRTVPQRSVPTNVVLITGRQVPAAVARLNLQNKVVLYIPQANADLTSEQQLQKQLRQGSGGLVILSDRDSTIFAVGIRIGMREPDVQIGTAWGAYVRPEAASGLSEVLKANGVDVARARTDTTSVVRDLPSLQIALEPAFSRPPGDTTTVPNVLAVLEGSDPKLKSEYIVYVAHMDHQGIQRGQADSIANGADDNASGTAGLIELAKAFSQPGARPARSIAFIATSGGAKNFWGTRAFVDRLGMSNALNGLFGGIFQIVMGSSSSPSGGGGGGGGGIQFSFGAVPAPATPAPPAPAVTPAPAPTPPATPVQDSSAAKPKDNSVIVLGGNQNNPPSNNQVISLPIQLGNAIQMGGSNTPSPAADTNSATIGNVVLAINLDMIGRKAGDSVTIDGLREVDVPTPPNWLAAAHPELRLTVRDGGTAANGESDHFPFIQQAIPALSIHNGSHTDVDASEAVDADLAARIVQLAFYMGQDIANGKRPPQWNAEGRRHYLGTLP